MSGIVGNYLEARCRQSRHPRGNYLEARCHRASDDAHMEVVLLDRYAVCMKLHGVVSMPLNLCSVRISPASLHVEGQGQRNGTYYLIVSHQHCICESQNNKSQVPCCLLPLGWGSRGRGFINYGVFMLLCVADQLASCACLARLRNQCHE